MATRKKKKPMRPFKKPMQVKLIVAFTIVSLLLVALCGRLMYISYTSGDKYEKICSCISWSGIPECRYVC